MKQGQSDKGDNMNSSLEDFNKTAMELSEEDKVLSLHDEIKKINDWLNDLEEEWGRNLIDY